MIARLAVIFALLSLSPQAAAEDIAGFLKTYCIRCHGPEKQEADRRFDRLQDLPARQRLELWQEMLDRVNLGEMPPEEAPQPESSVRVWAAEEIAALIQKGRKDVSPIADGTVLRRLNRFEYDRSVRQLLALESTLVDPTANFPPDESQGHFRNIGSSLVLSDFHLAGYLEAADVFLHAATHPETQPKTQRWLFTAPFCPTGNRHEGKDRPGRYQHLRKNYYDAGGFLWIKRFASGVPHSGNYRIRVKAEAIGRHYPYPEDFVKVIKADPLRMEVHAAAARGGNLDTNNPSDRLLAEIELPDNTPEWFEVTAWMDKGYQPRIAFPNGPLSTKALRSRLVRDYPQQFKGYIDGHVPIFSSMHPEFDRQQSKRLAAEYLEEQRRRKAAGESYAQFGISHSLNTRAAWSQFFSEYHGPRIRVYEIEIEGPFYDQWPPESHRRLFGEVPIRETEASELIRRFAGQAYRRPIAREAAESLTAVFDRERQRGVSLQESLLAAYQAILCSPSFLYLHQSSGALDEYDLASRLSYFLWSAPPDEGLLETAEGTGLSDPTTLAAEVDRMLRDHRAQAFVEKFADAWLGLDKLGTMLPSQRAHPEYFIENLERAMRRETLLFFEDAVRNDRAISEFLTGRYTFVNGPLARHYGIPGISGNEFQRVRLDSKYRGGLLGMASVLTATANGIETSPVVRGVWVLENILGTPPSPPPPDVEPIEPDIRGATTIREQLIKHRNVATCNACHKKIDPLGFALESFDEIGRLRTQYRSQKGGRKFRQPVDTSGQLATGEHFEDIRQLRPLLAARSDLFIANLASKLLTYGTGRIPTIHDRVEVDRIAEACSAETGFRDLIQQVVRSEAFRR
jgi:hypothetical protein